MVSGKLKLEEMALCPIQVIEEGLFSTISRTRINTSPPKWIAIKSATVHPGLSKEPHDIIKEVRLLSILSHPNIIPLLGSEQEKSDATLSYWMPYIPHTLNDLLASPSFSPHPVLSFFPESSPSPKESQFVLVAKSIMYQLISAMAYLHDTAWGIAHRDIKPANVLLTRDGCVKLIDFGIVWKEGEDKADKEGDLWKEDKAKMYFEVATGCYRAPELLFGPQTYDAAAADLWSLGATFAEFFTSLRLVRQDEDEDDDDGNSSSSSSSPETESLKPFIIPPSIRPGNRNMLWRRDSLFDAQRGEIGLAWSIFKIRGTPTDESWPTFKHLPNASLVLFQSAPPIDLSSRLPNLPPSAPLELSASLPSPYDLLHRLLVYPQSERIKAADALRHVWFAADPPVLLPVGYPAADADADDHAARGVGIAWEGKNIGEWLCTMLPERALLPGEEA